MERERERERKSEREKKREREKESDTFFMHLAGRTSSLRVLLSGPLPRVRVSVFSGGNMGNEQEKTNNQEPRSKNQQ